MGWSLSYVKPPREPQLLDALFLAAGKALHLANRFESKCQYILRIARLVKQAPADPVLSLQEIIESLPPDKMLGGTLKDLVQWGPGAGVVDRELLDRARAARNFIAHEGASVGSVWTVNRDEILEHATRLRAAVADLALGDDIVSRWIFNIEEPDVPMQEMTPNTYRTMVDSWVFSDFDILPIPLKPFDR